MICLARETSKRHHAIYHHVVHHVTRNKWLLIRVSPQTLKYGIVFASGDMGGLIIRVGYGNTSAVGT